MTVIDKGVVIIVIDILQRTPQLFEILKLLDENKDKCDHHTVLFWTSAICYVLSARDGHIFINRPHLYLNV